MPDESVINTESLEFLEQVKKGKPRKFVMICKGANIVSLVVYKKGSVDKYKKEAKKSGKGKLVHGVVDGKGPNINFKLARADGYDEQPTRSQILKKFLAENTDLKFKPMFEVVDNPQLVLDDEDPLVQRFLKLQDRAMAAAESNEADKIGRLCQQIGVHFDADEADQAGQKLDTLETLLKQVEGSTQPPPTPPQQPQETPSTPPVTDPAAELKTLMTRLSSLRPQAEEAIAAKVSISGDAKRLLAEAASFAKDRDLVSAGVVLDDLQKLLDNTQWRLELEKAGQARSLDDIKKELEPKLKLIWDKQSVKAVDSLTKLNKAFQSRQGEHYEAASQAVGDILTRLADAPVNPEQAKQMQDFLEGDESVTILDQSLKFKKPLLTVLAGVKQAYEVTAGK